MKLGGSLQRRRKGKGRRSRSGGGSERGRIALQLLGLVVGGWLAGYLVATQVVFPAPPPPGDLTEVPDVRGMGLSAARERIAGTGLTLAQIDSLSHPEAASGTVLGQSPLPGQLSLPGGDVRVTISIGAERRAVPDVVRLDADRARTILQTTGFVVRVDSVESDLPRGRVVSVAPPPDTVVALPHEVHLTVSTGPPVVRMPLVLGMEERDARSMLDSLGLVVSDVREVFRFGRDQGIVVEQEPAADTELARGAAVRLAVGRRGRDDDRDGR